MCSSPSDSLSLLRFSLRRINPLLVLSSTRPRSLGTLWGWLLCR
ncbi:hypothetical protein FOVG_19148 [Fusarium oxysporum f. sp. pisi HDV247]|uniref:Uncharacterized protein n=1 Tax=Fusarium oxysporum f. sp. pisi HDV247 TaxID=1080344 RepID=W9NNE1_FUSOX|nr:hypothetical protein FOVG_19148 [Fusarium oxysporum f. sp. pisi HDV247]